MTLEFPMIVEREVLYLETLFQNIIVQIASTTKKKLRFEIRRGTRMIWIIRYMQFTASF